VHAEFEIACQKFRIGLFVLPPSKPTNNGGVELGNRTFKEEFYCCNDLLAYSIGAIRYELKQAVLKYNTNWPHKTRPETHQWHIFKKSSKRPAGSLISSEPLQS